MKKTLISIVLIVSLLSTALFSVVFAGYSVSDSKTAYAVVSAFGVTVTVDNTGATSESKQAMAPGGSGTLISVTASGTPSVAANISYTITEVQLGTWTADSAFYCPVVFNVFGTQINGAEYQSADALIEAIEAVTYANDPESPLAADTALGNTHNKTISWTWAKDTNADKDNQLTAAATIQISVTASIVQK